jgi:hypothetical protein
MLKWKLMLTTLPFVLLVLLLTDIRTQTYHVTALFEFFDAAPIVTLMALMVGFMLSGVMADHTAERSPAEIACGLQVIQADTSHRWEINLMNHATLCQSVVNYAALPTILSANGTSPSFVLAMRCGFTHIKSLSMTQAVKRLGCEHG